MFSYVFLQIVFKILIFYIVYRSTQITHSRLPHIRLHHIAHLAIFDMFLYHLNMIFSLCYMNLYDLRMRHSRSLQTFVIFINCNMFSYVFSKFVSKMLLFYIGYHMHADNPFPGSARPPASRRSSGHI